MPSSIIMRGSKAKKQFWNRVKTGRVSLAEISYLYRRMIPKGILITNSNHCITPLKLLKKNNLRSKK